MLGAQILVTKSKSPKELNFVVERNTYSSCVWNVLHANPASMYCIIHAI